MKAAGLVVTIRLIGGMVLMLFVTCHLANLALGLVSLDVLEAWRPRVLAAWQTYPGLALLYGALASHLVLGLVALAKRRSTASFRATDVAQLALGLLIPPLLVLHVLGMRGTVALGGSHVSYGLALVIYWKLVPFYGLKQVLVVVIAWIHGCLGLYGWLRLRSWWPAIAGFLYPVAFALPILALLGFVEAGKQAIARYDGGDPVWAKAIETAAIRMGEVGAPLAGWENGFLIAYGAALVVALAAFAGRVVSRRRQRAQVGYVGGPTITAARGLSILEISRQSDIPHASACSGRGRCGTCRVRVVDGLALLSPIAAREAQTLKRIGATGPDIRLACQALVTGGLVTVERLVPAEAEEEAARHPGLFDGAAAAAAPAA
ncbi:MAG: (2Fe-2S)-binding protein [Proteobacteria bacterium]|nr:(2Fe-2S)-binding protein [Pseudomonadota bacterium]